MFKSKRTARSTISENSVKTVFKNSDFRNNYRLNQQGQCEKNVISEDVETYPNNSVYGLNILRNSPNRNTCEELDKYPKNDVISDFRKVVREQIREEIDGVETYFKDQFEEFKLEISDMFAKTKFMIISEFARFENQTFDEALGILFKKTPSQNCSSHDSLQSEETQQFEDRKSVV